MIVAFNEVPARVGLDAERPSSEVLTDLVLGLFGAAAPGSAVWGSVYHWSDRRFTVELRRIVVERGLRLGITAGDREHAFASEIGEFFETCVGKGGVFRVRPIERRNHDKWFLFERFDFRAFERALPVGVEVAGPLPASGAALCVSTGNLSAEDRGKNNAAIVIPIGDAMVRALQERFELVRRLYRVPKLLRKPADWWFERRHVYRELEDSRFRLCLFPRLDGVDTLERVVAALPVRSGPSSVRICSNRWNRRRLARALLDKYLEAPDTTQIEVIARSPDDWYDFDEDGIYEGSEMTPAVAEVLARCSTRYWQKHATDPETGQLSTTPAKNLRGDAIAVPSCLANIHSKYVLFDTPAGRSVWVGSPNMTLAAVKASFEILVELKDEPAAYAAFANNFAKLVAPLERGGLGATDAAIEPKQDPTSG
jgi:phosphatidylserine/phosphatidylglycerophosphate/cardiolipin synthase-like enzyme